MGSYTNTRKVVKRMVVQAFAYVCRGRLGITHGMQGEQLLVFSREHGRVPATYLFPGELIDQYCTAPATRERLHVQPLSSGQIHGSIIKLAKAIFAAARRYYW